MITLKINKKSSKKTFFRFYVPLFFLSLIYYVFSCKQVSVPHGNFVNISEDNSPEEIIEKASNVFPSPRQLEWQKLEYTAFVHFGLYTFNPKKVRLEREEYQKKMTPDSFNPKELDCRQWARIFKDAGMKGVILTAKHHDGFCLWPSQYTNFSVKNSKWKNGKGDVVKEMSNACREYGLKFGIYLSPHDRSSSYYGTAAYNEYFKNQLSELLTNYGGIFEVWFDGAHTAKGENGKKQDFDWQGFISLIREKQPNAVIAVRGPDVRWVGTESGYGRDTEWSVSPVSKRYLEVIDPSCQQPNKEIYYTPDNSPSDKDLGSRNKIMNTNSLVWYPSEVDVSIRPSWCYLQWEDSLVKTTEELMDIYYSSVGKNSLLLLNVGPDTRGLIHETDSIALMKFNEIREKTFKTNLLVGAQAKASNSQKGFAPSNILTIENYWTSPKKITTALIDINMKSENTFDRFIIQENIENGQRVESFILEAFTESRWKVICTGTTIGYKRILRFPETTSSRVRIKITGARANPEIKYVGLYKSPYGI